MKSKKQFNIYHKQVVIFLCFLILQFFVFPMNYLAAALTNVEALVSNSRTGIKADLTLEFTTSLDIGANGYFEFTLDEEFNKIEEVTCPGPNVTTATSSNVIRCTYSVSPGASTSTKLTIKNMYNPVDFGRYNIQMDTYNFGDNLLESGNAAVYITEAQEVSAYVGTVMTFSMVQDNVDEVNGIPIKYGVTATSTATMIDFGFVSSDSSSTLAHTINLRTNAENGYSCTVQQDHELVNENNDTINSFSNAFDGTGSSTDPQPWTDPAEIDGQDHTYGHLGISSNDPELSELDFSGSKYVGFDGTEAIEVLYHPTPTVNNVAGEGKVNIAYTLAVSALQEKGVYSNSIMYICTGNF
ncbi:MAG: hypothetical protein U9Q85_00700 [Patescibacteria group bacterium]|nr:hypothetical protein [Patescibacteria group bacterium]